MASSSIKKSEHRLIFVFLFSLTAAVLFVLFRSITYGSTPTPSLIGCLETESGTLKFLSTGSSPLKPCKEESTQVTLGNGTINSILAGTGLTGGGATSAVTLAVANNGITKSLLADGSVTPDKISNDASEPSRVQTWVDDNTDFAFPVAVQGDHTIPTPITLTVPAGKAYNYIVSLDGRMKYIFGERLNSSPGFYGEWYGNLYIDNTNMGQRNPIIQTGYRQDWGALGGSSYWDTPYHVVWFARLGEGAHSLSIHISGHSDNTMVTAHFSTERLQVMRVF